MIALKFILCLAILAGAWYAAIKLYRAAPQEDKWNKHSRRLKRAVRIDKNGKDKKLILELANIAKDLPEFKSKKGIAKDHVNSMRKAYMRSGASGIESYIRMTREAAASGGAVYA